MTMLGPVRFLLLLCCFLSGEAITPGAADSNRSNSSSHRLLAADAAASTPKPVTSSRPHGSAVEQLLGLYYAGKLQPAQPAVAGAVVTEASAKLFPWAKTEWGRYRQRAVIYADSDVAGSLALWAWDIVPEAAVRQAQLVLSAMVRELHSDIRRNLLAASPSKVALFKRPEQVWTDIPEHSIWKGTDFGAMDMAGVGGTVDVPVSSFDTRNVLEAGDDPYREESVLVHEFGHHIHNLALPSCVAAAANAAYANAVSSGAYTPGRYMVSSVYEYMANAAAAWFQGTCRADVNDGIISRPRLFARDPTLFSLLQYIYTPSVVRTRYRNICPACSTKWTPEAQVPLSEPAPPAPLIRLPLEQCTSVSSSWRPVPYNAPDCTDLRPDCRAKALAGDCDTAPYMLGRCRLSCGVCRQVSNSPGCFDRDASCLVAASLQGRCQNDTVRMGPRGLGCLVSCGKCTAVRPSPSPPAKP